MGEPTATILVADDEAGVRDFVVDALAAEGHLVVEAKDGRDALDRLRERPFHLLITDLKMPGEPDGMGLLRHARGERPEMQVIVLTAHGAVDTAVAAMKLGACDYLEKPISGPAQLRNLVSWAAGTAPARAPVGERDGQSVSGDAIAGLAAGLARALGRHYAVQDLIGRGAYAAVFRVADHVLGRTLAAKVLLPQFASDAETAERFRREAQIAAGLNHSHIVPVYFVSRERDIPFIMMPLIAGGPLSALLARRGPLPIPVVLRIVRELSSALDFAHQSGILHRDVKPENVLLEEATGCSLLTDFGIAKRLRGEAATTIPGMFLGTPTYVSPEQALGETALDVRSDIYSLGVVAYEMLAGRPPFRALSALRILAQQVSVPVPPLRDHGRDLGEATDRVMAQALAKDPARRFSTSGAFASALRTAVRTHF